MLGAIEVARGEPASAIAAFRRCIVLAPGIADAYANLGRLLRADAAMAEQRRALALAPGNSEHWVMAGETRLTLRDATGAQEHFEQALAQKPDSAAARLGLGKALRDQGKLGEALLAQRAALALDPGAAVAWQELGHSARKLDPVLAAEAYARASQLAPGNGRMLSEWFVARRSLCDWRDEAMLAAKLRAIIDEDRSSVLPLADLLLDLSPAQQSKAALRFAREFLGEPQPWRPASAAVEADRPLTIAYLSSDFHDHATAYLAAEVFERHDRSRFHVLAYSYGPASDGAMRRRLLRAFDAVRELRASGGDHVAAIAAEDRVDILIDLKGFTSGARLDLLARRLAPIQATWLGYPGTLGTATFDYILGDATVTPPEHQRWFAEQFVRLPDSYQPNDRERPLPDGTVDRAAHGLPADAIVFGALHAPHKIGPAIFADWMRILRAVPRSVLWLYAPRNAVRDALRRSASAAGIAPDRLVFARPVPQAEHVGRLDAADLMLDAFPYTGHTTTSDALWAGVPVVTRIGDGFAARVAAGLVGAAGVGELAMPSRDAYVELAVALARDGERIAELKRRLVANRFTCSLFDSARFTRQLEAAYRIMWRRHAAGLPPAPFDVPRDP